MDINNLQIRDKQPYPDIIDARNDARTVAILKDLLSGRNGEIAGIMQYFYQSELAKNVEPEIAEILQEIAIVEMGHMELIMEAIIAFGGIPKYETSKNQAFNSTYINYPTKLKEMLDANIAGEQQGINEYLNAVRMVDNVSLKELLNRIVKDEKLHLNTFKTLRNKVQFLSI